MNSTAGLGPVAAVGIIVALLVMLTLLPALLVTCGILGGVGQIFLTAAYREADASLVAPFDYASMLFALAIGYWAFGEVPTFTTLGGAVLIVSAGVLIILRERHLGIKRARQRKAMTPQG